MSRPPQFKKFDDEWHILTEYTHSKNCSHTVYTPLKNYLLSADMFIGITIGIIIGFAIIILVDILFGLIL